MIIEAKTFSGIEADCMTVPGLMVVNPDSHMTTPLTIKTQKVTDDRGRNLSILYLPETVGPKDPKTFPNISTLRAFFDAAVTDIIKGSPSDGIIELVNIYNIHALRVFQEDGDLYGFPPQIAYHPQP